MDAIEHELRNAKLFRHRIFVTAHPQLLAILQQDHVVAVKPGLDFTDAVNVDDGRAVDAREVARIKLPVQGRERGANLVAALAHMQAAVVSFRLNPIDLSGLHQQNAVVFCDREAFKVLVLPLHLLERSRDSLAQFAL